VRRRHSLIDARNSAYSTVEDSRDNSKRSRVGYKFNMTGRSIQGGGSRGRSNSPSSHSGMDPNLVRGKSSQLDFEMHANE
jgi:hypothetical protein